MDNTILSPIFLDTTLRDGEQRPGVSFTRQAKLGLARALDDWGVGILEVGIPAMGRSERTTLDQLHREGLKAELLVWNRLCDEDWQLCKAAGYPSVHFSIPASDLMLKGKLGKDRAWALDQVDRIVGKAVEAGVQVSLGAEDASRADQAFLLKLYQRGISAGASRIRYADTLGVLAPHIVSRTIAAIAAAVSVPLDFHGHNDFGLATANTLAAAAAGAQVLSCSLLGLGERAGNAALEEVYAALSVLPNPGGPVNPQLARLVSLCRAAALLAGVEVPAHKPLVGDEVFSHQSGIHVDGLLKDPRTYEAWPPESLGGHRRVRFGKHSGTAAVRHLASVAGAVVADTATRTFLEHLRDRMGQEAGLDPEKAFEDFLKANGRPL